MWGMCHYKRHEAGTGASEEGRQEEISNLSGNCVHKLLKFYPAKLVLDKLEILQIIRYLSAGGRKVAMSHILLMWCLLR